MPKIVALKEIDGAMWARLDLDLGSGDQPVHLLHQSEIDHLLRQERLMCADIAEDEAKALDWGHSCSEFCEETAMAIAKTIRESR